jgi:glycosyltransferase involved in cell wall biosynthesis
MRISWVSFLNLDADLCKTRELEILKALADRGHATTLVATASRRDFKIKGSRVNLIAVPMKFAPLVSNILYTVFLIIFLPIHILFSQPDFIVMDPSISVLGSIPSLIFSRFTRTNFVLDIKSTPVEVKGIRPKLAAFWFNISVLIAKLMFQGIEIVTPMMKTELCQKFDIDPQTVGVWTNGVPINLFNPKTSLAESATLRKELDLSNRFVVFYHGVFSASRGLTETVDAIQILKQKYPEIMFFLLGTGSIVSSLENSIKQKNLQDNIIIHYPVPYEEVPKFIGLSDVCIVPLPNISYWKFQSPLKLMEYLAMEKVVLATDIPAHKLVVGDKKCCIYLRFINPSEIAKSVEYAYINKTNLGSWGKIGRKIVEENYTWDKVAEEVENYFGQLVTVC